MAFVNEKIPEEEKEKFEFPVFTETDGSKPTLWKWTIDKERDAFLVITDKEGGGYQGTPETCHFALSWRGNFINFIGELQFLGNSRSEQSISWKVSKLVISSEIKNRHDEVFELIRESLDVMGWLYDRECLVAVNVDFIPTSGA